RLSAFDRGRAVDAHRGKDRGRGRQGRGAAAAPAPPPDRRSGHRHVLDLRDRLLGHAPELPHLDPAELSRARLTAPPRRLGEGPMQTGSHILLSGAPEGFDARLIARELERGHPVIHVARDDRRMEAMRAALAFMAPEAAVMTLP